MQYGKSFGNSIYTAGTGAKLEEGAGGSITLASGTTYYVPIGSQSAPLIAAQVVWDATITLTVTVEASLGDDYSVYSATAGEWIQYNPSTAYVPVTGGTATAASVVTTPALGGCIFDVGNTGARRLRLKLVVAGTGGVVRIIQHGKA